MPNIFFTTSCYKTSKMSLLSIILGWFLALSYQTLSLGKSIKNQTLNTNQNHSQNTIFTSQNNTSNNEPLITDFFRDKRPVENLPPLIITPSAQQQETIFNPIEPNPFPSLQYIVYIDSKSQILLRIIRQIIEPRAVFRFFNNRKVIQVGSFSELFFTLDLLDFLKEKGIHGKRLKLNPGEAFGKPVSSTTLAATIYPPVTNSIAYGLNSKSYYLLIPSQSKDLAITTYKLGLLGVPDRGIQVTEIPENVAIGPFENEKTAEKWQRYLLDSGFINVVIYYGR
ncbi:MAG: hypothetical protein O4861_04060 [Trichodesmium sp. St16_bin4-tuft]|nr:hypothetical protein [Trichodesmium sp. MAG_R01]MDE5070684.1 hypothetical protein [Trichodesmium sp. St5_bin8]MDE5090356.1 hypothetical protein [Trichodesmium sp. St18_bin3_1_1]MDE5097554.1 hypothetical protein [Trichodesmium sp. St16_bin4-tuft]